MPYWMECSTTGKAIMAGRKKSDIVQVRNPRSDRYVKIDRAAGRIVSHKKSEGSYKGVPIARRRSRVK